MIERCYSLSAAAKAIGINRHTLKKWLAEDLAIVLPTLARGQKVLIRERDLELLMRKRTVSSNWALMRGAKAAS